jgi:hypothetical protein
MSDLPIAADCWRQGHKARQRGLPRKHNPYAKDDILSVWWLAGWERADTDMRPINAPKNTPRDRRARSSGQ